MMRLRAIVAFLFVVFFLSSRAQAEAPPRLAAAKPSAKPAAKPSVPPPATAEPPAGSVSPPPVVPNEPGTVVRVHDLERRVDELKEQVFRSKARLNLLKEAVLGGVIAGSRAVIRHQNAMGSAYQLIKAVYALDGAQIFAKTDDSGRLNDAKLFDVFNGSIVPGSHTLAVILEYQGNGYGVFSYLRGYKFHVRSSHTFNAAEGKLTELTARAYEKGNFTTSLEERPGVDFRVNVLSDRPQGIR